MIVNDGLEPLVSQKCVLFGLYDRHCSHLKPRVQKNVSYLNIMIINDLLHSLGRPICVILTLHGANFFCRFFFFFDLAYAGLFSSPDS